MEFQKGWIYFVGSSPRMEFLSTTISISNNFSTNGVTCGSWSQSPITNHQSPITTNLQSQSISNHNHNQPPNLPITRNNENNGNYKFERVSKNGVKVRPLFILALPFLDLGGVCHRLVVNGKIFVSNMVLCILIRFQETYLKKQK